MGAYHRDVLLVSGTGWIDAAILASIVLPIGGFVVFAIWFLRRPGD